MKERDISFLENRPFTVFDDDGNLLHLMYVKIPKTSNHNKADSSEKSKSSDLFKLFEIDPALYPDDARMHKALSCVSFKYSIEAKRYRYLQNINTPLRTTYWECKTEEEKQFLILAQNPNIINSALEAIEFEISQLKAAGVKYKQVKSKCTNSDERSLLSLNTQKHNMINKIAKCSTEMPEKPIYSFMEPYQNLKIMSPDLYFQGNKFLNDTLRKSQKYNNDLSPVKYGLNHYQQSLFDELLKLGDKLHLASTSEHELIVSFQEWKLNITMPLATFSEPVRMPKECRTDIYWCNLCGDSTHFFVEDNAISILSSVKCRFCKGTAEHLPKQNQY